MCLCVRLQGRAKEEKGGEVRTSRRKLPKYERSLPVVIRQICSFVFFLFAAFVEPRHSFYTVKIPQYTKNHQYIYFEYIYKSFVDKCTPGLTKMSATIFCVFLFAASCKRKTKQEAPTPGCCCRHQLGALLVPFVTSQNKNTCSCNYILSSSANGEQICV